MALISDWRKAWRFWSVRFAALGATVSFALAQFPEVALTLWAALPPQMRSAIPDGWMLWITFALFVGSMWGRVVKQKDLDDENVF